MRGRFITIEGAEGSGKTSLASALKTKLLEDHGITAMAFKEPGAAYQGQLRELLLSGKATPMSELMLFLADRAQNVATNIKPALDNGVWVILDRFSDSTIIYQALIKQVVDVITCRHMCKLAEQGVQPDQTIVVRAPFAVCQNRLASRNETQRLAQRDGITTEMQIWWAYETFSHRETDELDNVRFFKNNDTIEKLCNQVIDEALISFIEETKSA